MTQKTATAKRPPRARDRSACISSTVSAAGPWSAASASAAVGWATVAAVSSPRRENAHGTTTSETSGAAAMPSATAVWPSAMPMATATGKQDARGGLEQHQPSVEPEALVPRKPATGEVARGVGQDGTHQDPVERVRPVEHAVADPTMKRQGDGEEGEGERELDEHRRAHRVGGADAARAAVGDRAGEELLDGPVDDRDDHESDRPQRADAPVRVLVEHVARDGEVREGDDAGRRDADRQHACAAAVVAARGAPGHVARPLRGPSSRGTASGPRRRGRAARASPRTTAWTSG